MCQEVTPDTTGDKGCGARCSTCYCDFASLREIFLLDIILNIGYNRIMHLLVLLLILSPWNEYWGVKRLYNESKFDSAKDGFNSLIKKYPKGEIVPYCRYYIANLTTDPEEATDYYRDIVKFYPKSKVADNALLRLAFYYYVIGEYSISDSILTDLIISYPEGDCTKEANGWREVISSFKTDVFFAIQIGAFAEKQNAEKLSSLYENANIVFDGVLYKVRIGRFFCREDAVRLKEDNEIDGFIVKMP